MDHLAAGGTELGFPLWIRLTHWFNFLFLTLLVRSGLAILAAHPKLYWNIHSRPGSEWIRFTRKEMPKDRMWCSTDEEEAWPPWLALPGGEALGLGRYWHFANALGWLVCGLIYVSLLFLSPQWQRLVPTSWEVIPLAARDMGMYMTFQTPPSGTPYGPSPFNPLQQLTYFALVFVLSPFMILTGLAQSPSILGRFPWYERAFDNRQAARSLHFLGMIGFVLFLLIHILMVIWHGFAQEMDRMVLGRELSGSGWWLGAAIGLAIIAGVVVFHAFGNLASSRFKRATHRTLATIVDPIREGMLHRLHSVQQYPESMISAHFRLNGYPPISAYPQARGDDFTYEELLAHGFADYRLEVRGMVENPLFLSLDDLRAMPRHEQTTLHHCIQGWTSIGRWGGVPLTQVVARSRPLPDAKYVVFHSFGKHEKTGKPYYECVSLEVASHPQAILADTLNGQPLPVQHGAPVRVRFETKLGFKMVKYVKRIEFVHSYRHIGGGMGGVREDEQQFDMGAEI